MSDATYKTLAEQREEKLKERIEFIYLSHVDKQAKACDLSIGEAEGGRENTFFTVYENGVAKARCQFSTYHYKQVLNGNSEPKISSSFFTPLPQKKSDA